MSLKNEAVASRFLFAGSESMAVKSKVKPNSKVKAAVKSKSVTKKTMVKKPVKKAAVKSAKPVSAVKTVKRTSTENTVEVTRTVNLAGQIRQPARAVLRKAAPGSSSNPFTFMKAPRPEYAFEVGDTVEVFCDHEKGRERVRGWIKGIVVQVDNKMVAVQFRSNVFLTDGWMVPDRILWYPLNSEHIRPATTGKKPALKKDILPDY
jgi:hypothetical protein